jgi:hypothetical protein
MARAVAEIGRGDRFGLLTVVGEGDRDARGSALWWCACDCGARVSRTSYDLTSGRVYSCGCRYRPRRGKAEDVRAVECEPVAGGVRG